jgi:hypothetical protein
MNKIVYIVMKEQYGNSFPWAAFDSKEKAVAEVRQLFPKEEYELSDFTIELMITEMVIE